MTEPVPSHLEKDSPDVSTRILTRKHALALLSKQEPGPLSKLFVGCTAAQQRKILNSVSNLISYYLAQEKLDQYTFKSIEISIENCMFHSARPFIEHTEVTKKVSSEARREFLSTLGNHLVVEDQGYQAVYVQLIFPITFEEFVEIITPSFDDKFHALTNGIYRENRLNLPLNQRKLASSIHLKPDIFVIFFGEVFTPYIQSFSYSEKGQLVGNYARPSRGKQCSEEVNSVLTLHPLTSIQETSVAMPLLPWILLRLEGMSSYSTDPQSTASKAFRMLKVLITNYDEETRAALHFPQLMSASAQMAASALSQIPAKEESEIRQRLAKQFEGKLMGYLRDWSAHINNPSNASDLDRQRFNPLYRLANNLLWISRHTRAGSEKGELYLSVEANVLSKLDYNDREEIFDQLTDMFVQGVLSFPWKRLHWDQAAAERMMTKLRSFTPRIDEEFSQPHNIRFEARALNSREGFLFPLTFRGSYQNFRHTDEDYQEMDLLVDLFQEQARLSARRQDTPKSPLEEWSDPGFVRKVLETASKKFRELTPHSLREAIYQEAKECTQFKPSLAKGVITFFDARRVLDFSAGWGDRLAGAIAAGVELYQGFDPNTSLRAGHQELIRRFVPTERQVDFDIHYTSYEDANLPVGITFDLVFTSPPFFDFEIYTDLPGQSVQRYQELDQWLVGFLLRSLRKSWEVLEENGHLVIHLTDVFKTKVCEKMCLLIQWFLEGAVYQGVMCSFGGADRPRPIWVFQKLTSKHNKALAQHAAAELRRISESTWREAKELLV